MFSFGSTRVFRAQRVDARAFVSQARERSRAHVSVHAPPAVTFRRAMTSWKKNTAATPREWTAPRPIRHWSRRTLSQACDECRSRPPDLGHRASFKPRSAERARGRASAVSSLYIQRHGVPGSLVGDLIADVRECRV